MYVTIQPTLNEFMGAGRPVWKEARATLQDVLSSDNAKLRDNSALCSAALTPVSEVRGRVRVRVMVGCCVQNMDMI